MTYQLNYTLPNELLEQIATEGLEALPEMIQIVINTAMKAERQKYLGVGPYERSPERQDYANGYKDKTVTTRVGDITFAVPQVRQGPFYPSALEKGLRSERALLSTLAEMYVQGVSTRKVAAITEQLCGTSVSSTQVSRATAQLDEVLQAWRQRRDRRTQGLPAAVRRGHRDAPRDPGRLPRPERHHRLTAAVIRRAR